MAQGVSPLHISSLISHLIPPFPPTTTHLLIVTYLLLIACNAPHSILHPSSRPRAQGSSLPPRQPPRPTDLLLHLLRHPLPYFHSRPKVLPSFLRWDIPVPYPSRFVPL